MEHLVAELVTEESLASLGPQITTGFLGSLDEAALLALSPQQLLLVVEAWERVAGFVTAAQAAAMTALSARMAQDPAPYRRDLDPDAETVEELALALRLSSAAAAARVTTADGLQALPVVAAALRQGRLGATHARVLTDCLTGLTPDLPDAVRASLERVLVQRAVDDRLTPGQLRRLAQRLILRADPEGAEQRRRRAVRGRDVSCRADDHGMAWLSAYLPAPSALACLESLDAHARHTLGDDPDDHRGLGARRADALVNLVLTGSVDGNPPDDATVPATVAVSVHVTVPLTTLSGAGDEAGEIDGLGPIDAALARDLAHHPHATWRRLVTDPVDGRLVDAGTTRYHPPSRLDRHVRLRDVTCRWPGCMRPARRCDLDHTAPWPAGPTSEDNLTTLCRHHHRLKTLGRFQAARIGDILQVVTPLGRRLTTGPWSYRATGLHLTLPALGPPPDDQGVSDGC
jgi:hypothetical protein